LHEFELIHDDRESIIFDGWDGILLQKFEDQTRSSDEYLGLRLLLTIVELMLEGSQGLVEVTKS
jgi:hypothetical protein